MNTGRAIGLVLVWLLIAREEERQQIRVDVVLSVLERLGNIVHYLSNHVIRNLDLSATMVDVRVRISNYPGISYVIVYFKCLSVKITNIMIRVLESFSYL